MDLKEDLLVEKSIKKTKYIYVSSLTGELIQFSSNSRNCITQEEFENVVYNILGEEEFITSYSIKKEKVCIRILTPEDSYDWSFLLDFNDCGCITGEFTVEAEKEESNLPYYLGTLIQDQIFEILKSNVHFHEKVEYYQRKVVKRELNNHFVEISALILLVLFLGGVGINEAINTTIHENNGDIQVNFSSSDLLDKDYEYAYKILEASGFNNITKVKKNDLVTGIIDSEHTVESISINGQQKFSKGDWFNPDSKIVIEYHAYLLE